MNAARYPVYLQPVVIREQSAEEGAATRRVRRLLSRAELLCHLDAVGDLAPRAPLSFLVVRVSSLETVEAERGEVGVRFIERAVGEALGDLCRGTDIAGELGRGTFGVILQGAGAMAAAASAARLTHHLNRLAFLPPACSVVVGTATGTGIHGRRLAWAAMESFDAGYAGG